MEGDLFNNKYRIKSIRYDGWDYANEGFYFITICTKNRKNFFGNIVDGKIILNKCGKIVEKEWLKTEKIRKNVGLDEFVVMPNHIHGIIEIKYKINNPDNYEMYSNACPPGEYKNKFGPQSNNISAIIRGFKGVTTKIIHRKYVDFNWQDLFYDRIIRDGDELNRIKQYIIDNPLKWQLDRNNPENF